MNLDEKFPTKKIQFIQMVEAVINGSKNPMSLRDIAFAILEDYNYEITSNASLRSTIYKLSDRKQIKRHKYGYWKGVKK